MVTKSFNFVLHVNSFDLLYLPLRIFMPLHVNYFDALSHHRMSKKDETEVLDFGSLDERNDILDMMRGR